jgi:hypothetical protein
VGSEGNDEEETNEDVALSGQVGEDRRLVRDPAGGLGVPVADLVPGGSEREDIDNRGVSTTRKR